MATTNTTNTFEEKQVLKAPTAAAAPKPATFDQSGVYKDLATGSQVNANTTEFDESKGVAGRVNSLTSSGSPLLEAARTRAAQNANARGLRNSSMAVQSGEQAVIETATPIAQADASLFQNQQLANQSAKNQADQFNANIRTNVGLQGAGAAADESKFGRTLLEEARQFNATGTRQDRQFADEQKYKREQLQMQQTLAQMDATSRKELATIESEFKADIASNENISNAWGTMMGNINQIQNNPDLDAAAKKQLIDNQVASFRSFTNFWRKVTGGDVDVSDLLNFGSGSGGKPPVREVPTTPGRKDNGQPVEVGGA